MDCLWRAQLFFSFSENNSCFLLDGKKPRVVPWYLYIAPSKGEMGIFLGIFSNSFMEGFSGLILYINRTGSCGSTGCQDDTFKAHTDGHAYGDKLLKLHLSVCFFSSSIHW